MEFLKANPEPEFNLDFFSDTSKVTKIIRNPEDLDKYNGVYPTHRYDHVAT